MSQICADPVTHSFDVSRTRSERERALSACTNGECEICKGGSETCDFVDANHSVSSSRKRCASDTSGRSRSSSPEGRPNKRLCVASALQRNGPLALANDIRAAAGAGLSPASLRTSPPPHLPPEAPLHALNIYTDGSVLDNGKAGARGGLGIYYEDKRYHILNRSERLQGAPPTSCRAELTAAISALEEAPSDVHIILHTDSQNVLKTMECLPSWKSQGFRKKSGGAVADVDLVLQLERQINMRGGKVRLVYVKGHSGVYGNEMADRLAKRGANKPLPPPSP